MTANAKILLVDDEPAIQRALGPLLRSRGYDVTIAGTGADALRLVAEQPPDLIVLDLGLPDLDGLEVCRRIHRLRPDLDVIMLTARDDELDIVTGLDTGAVDYITKPFKLAELLARVRAQLRRVEHPRSRDHLDLDGLAIDVGARRVFLDGQEIELRAKEFDLLVRLAADAGNTVTRETLMAEVWDEHWFGSTKTLDVHMSSLRRRLGEQPGEPSRITSLRGIGYRWELAE